MQPRPLSTAELVAYEPTLAPGSAKQAGRRRGDQRRDLNDKQTRTLGGKPLSRSGKV
jgi:hypothetical protein